MGDQDFVQVKLVKTLLDALPLFTCHTEQVGITFSITADGQHDLRGKRFLQIGAAECFKSFRGASTQADDFRHALQGQEEMHECNYRSLKKHAGSLVKGCHDESFS